MNLKYTFKFNPAYLLVALTFVLLPFSLFAEMKLGWTAFAYVDESICVATVIYFVYYLITRTKFKQYEMLILIITALLTLIGLFSNIRSKVITSWFPVIVDAVCLLKIFLPFLACVKIAQKDKGRLTLLYLKPISKLLLILGAIFGTISQFVNIGMTDPSKRYGISPFFFVFQNEGRYGYIVAICLCIILITEKDRRKHLIYNALAILNMIYTTKGVVYVVLASYIVLSIMWKRRKKLSVANIVILSLVGVIVSTVQIDTYLKDFESPRVRLIKYGFVTAKSYFPFGSGFATYGSDMAMKNYSKLYDLYGFENFYGLSREVSSCLNDCYLGMVIGQFGYIGLIVFVILLALCFVGINKINFDHKIKALCFAIFIGIIVSSVGTAIIKSSIGVMIFAFLGLIVGYSFQNTENQKSQLKEG